MAIAKEQLRQMIRENDISSIGDIYSLMNCRLEARKPVYAEKHAQTQKNLHYFSYLD